MHEIAVINPRKRARAYTPESVRGLPRNWTPASAREFYDRYGGSVRDMAAVIKSWGTVKDPYALAARIKDVVTGTTEWRRKTEKNNPGEKTMSDNRILTEKSGSGRQAEYKVYVPVQAGKVYKDGNQWVGKNLQGFIRDFKRKQDAIKWVADFFEAPNQTRPNPAASDKEKEWESLESEWYNMGYGEGEDAAEYVEVDEASERRGEWGEICAEIMENQSQYRSSDPWRESAEEWTERYPEDADVEGEGAQELYEKYSDGFSEGFYSKMEELHGPEDE